MLLIALITPSFNAQNNLDPVQNDIPTGISTLSFPNYAAGVYSMKNDDYRVSRSIVVVH